MAKYKDLIKTRQVHVENMQLLALMLTDVKNDIRREAWAAAFSRGLRQDYMSERGGDIEPVDNEVELGPETRYDVLSALTESQIRDFLVALDVPPPGRGIR